MVFGSELDDGARDAVLSWSKKDAVLLTPADLFCKGWRTTSGKVDDWSFVASGERYPARSISGIVTMVSRIFAHELFDVEPNDRNYAAAEATAFALFFLSKVPCPVVNRPTANCLTGPNWRPEQWLRACFEAGIRTKESKRTNRVLPQKIDMTGLKSVTVLAGKCLEDTSEGCLSSVLKLASLANVTFLRVCFTQENGQRFFYKAEVVPDLGDRKIRKALGAYFSVSGISW